MARVYVPEQRAVLEVRAAYKVITFAWMIQPTWSLSILDVVSDHVIAAENTLLQWARANTQRIAPQAAARRTLTVVLDTAARDVNYRAMAIQMLMDWEPATTYDQGDDDERDNGHNDHT